MLNNKKSHLLKNYFLINQRNEIFSPAKIISILAILSLSIEAGANQILPLAERTCLGVTSCMHFLMGASACKKSLINKSFSDA